MSSKDKLDFYKCTNVKSVESVTINFPENVLEKIDNLLIKFGSIGNNCNKQTAIDKNTFVFS